MKIRIKGTVDAYLQILPFVFADPDEAARRKVEIDARLALLAKIAESFNEGEEASIGDIYDKIGPLIAGGPPDRLWVHLLGNRLPETDGEKLIWLARRTVGRVVYDS